MATLLPNALFAFKPGKNQEKEKKVRGLPSYTKD